jgi:hypothetical protein
VETAEQHDDKNSRDGFTTGFHGIYFSSLGINQLQGLSICHKSLAVTMDGKQNNDRFLKNNRRRFGVSGDLDERTGVNRQDAKTAKVSSATNEHRLSQTLFICVSSAPICGLNPSSRRRRLVAAGGHWLWSRFW